MDSIYALFCARENALQSRRTCSFSIVHPPDSFLVVLLMTVSRARLSAERASWLIWAAAISVELDTIGGVRMEVGVAVAPAQVGTRRSARVRIGKEIMIRSFILAEALLLREIEKDR
jgi:hypothetical protein